MADPMTMMALAGGLSSLFGGGSTPAQSQTFYSPEMRDQMLNYLRQFGGQLNSLFGTPSQGAGGVTTRQATQTKIADKDAAFVDYLVKQKGVSEKEAQQRLKAIKADPNRSLMNNKGFVDYIRGGNVEGLSIGSNGGIITAKELTPGGFGVSEQSENLGSAFQGLNAEMAQALQGLPTLFGADAARALQSKMNLGNMAQNFLGETLTQSGLSPQNEQDLAAMEAALMQKFGDVRRDSLQQTVGNLVGSGFTSSNLAADALKRGAHDVENRFLTDALATLAGQRDSMMNNAVSRQSQGLGNILNTFGALGANQGMAGLTSGLINPNQAGMFNDVQSAQLANQIQQQNIQNQMGFANMMQQGLSQPVQMMPNSPGLFSQIAQYAAPFAGFGLGSGELGKIGSKVGGALGKIGSKAGVKNS
jgi:hypothetical protein